jgi:predicted enzyme related to lactoylglutathione lyase
VRNFIDISANFIKHKLDPDMIQSPKFFYVKVDQLEDAAIFYRDQLGMTVEHISVPGTAKCYLVKHDQHTQILLSENHSQNQTAKVTLPTNDCLANYCKLKARGVNFKKTPLYLDQGLCVVFSDPFGNEYTLLEERSYNES